MTIISLDSTLYSPPFPDAPAGTPTISTTQIAMGSSTGEVAYILQAPKTGDIDRITFRTSTVTTGSTIEIRLETVDDSTGYPSGTLVDTNSNITQVINSADDNVLFEVTLTGAATVTQGQKVAVRFKNSSGSPVIYFGGFADWSAFTTPQILESTNSGTSWTQQANYSPIVAFRYSDATYPEINGVVPLNTVSTTNISSSTTPDEVGNLFTPTQAYRVVGYWAWQDLDGAGEIKMYDASGVVANSTVSLAGTYPLSGAGDFVKYFLETPITLTPNTDYGIVLKKTDTTTSLYYSCDVSDVKYMTAMPSGGKFTQITAKDPTDLGDFTETTTAMVFMGLIIDAIDITASGGATSYGYVS